ncbi:MAG: hypothetical protein EOP00_35255 [Pedobacter sp.]|nr:MAG: hypothetical protein EOP00_35255 [Pedobacter sp.]
MDSKIPQQYKDLVGTDVELQGGVFSGNRSINPTKFQCLDIRWGSATVVNFKELKEKGESSYEHPTYNLLVKCAGMKKSRWTRGFAIREINLKESEVENA